MVIAVDSRSSQRPDDGSSRFLHEVFSRLARTQSQHKFYFFSDRPRRSGTQDPLPALKIPRPAYLPLISAAYWRRWQLPRALTMRGADLMVTPDPLICRDARKPPCMLLYGNPGINPGCGIPTLQRCSRILTWTETARSAVVGRYRPAGDKTDVVPYGATLFDSAALEENAAVKRQFAGDTEFFLCLGDFARAEPVVNLLRGFSIFKRRLHSGMKMVLAGTGDTTSGDLITLLQSYRYRDDVVLIDRPPDKDRSRLVAAAYALINPFPREDQVPLLLEAMGRRSPVLTATSAALDEVCIDAALYFEHDKPDTIGDQLMRIYKNEELRKSTIQNGGVVVLERRWDVVAEKMWQSVLRAVSGT